MDPEDLLTGYDLKNLAGSVYNFTLTVDASQAIEQFLDCSELITDAMKQLNSWGGVLDPLDDSEERRAHRIVPNREMLIRPECPLGR